MKSISKISLALLTVLALSAVTSRAEAPLRNTGHPVTLFIRGPGGSMITPDSPPSTPLWDSRFGLPALAPDGHQITLEEWLRVQSRAEAKCVRKGTHVVIHLSGLIPNGVYTVWVLVFDGPFPAGPDGAAPFPFGNLVGVGSLGANDGSENSFKASASGEGQISVNMPPGPLSTTPPWLAGTAPYDVGGCLLDEFEFHLVGVYHFDGKSYGPTPGFVHGGSEQFGIQMQP